MIWSKDYTLAIEDLWLHFKDWVELIPAGPDNEDVGAISSKREIKDDTILSQQSA